MNAVILSIGTELTRGELIDTNTQWLSEQLTDLGCIVIEQVSIPDETDLIGQTIHRLKRQAEVVIGTGGLGPTTDDLTSEAVAAALNVQLKMDEPSIEAIRTKFKRFGQSMPRSNLKQALFPEGAEILINQVGTAPGFAVSVDETRCFFLPGVPHEMKHIFTKQVLPRIAPLVKKNTHQIHIQTFGLTESRIADMISALDIDRYRDDKTGSGIVLGYRAHFPEIEVKVLAHAGDADDARRLAERVAEEVRQHLGPVVFGARGDSFSGYLGRVLRTHHLTLAVAESCTGGLIGKLITDEPGSSDYFVMDAITYSNRSKCEILDVKQATIERYGAVSAEVAQAMVEGVLKVSGADVAVAVTGIAGPAGGGADKPVGLVWFGLARKGRETIVKSHNFPGDRFRVRMISAYFALKMVIDSVLDSNSPKRRA